jgi:hypothetical protein
VCEDSGTVEARSHEVNQIRQFSEYTWRHIVNFIDLSLRRFCGEAVWNSSKCLSLKFWWVIDLEREKGPLIPLTSFWNFASSKFG